jgi:serine/threonine protein kinase
MTPTRWQRVQDLVNAALKLPEIERASFLREICGGTGELLCQVEEFVRSYEQAGSVIERAVESSALEAFTENSPTKGERIGVYEITGTIGQGGMGTVYCARRIDDFRQRVAIKILSAGFAAKSELLTRFRAERQILASLTHPNIARLLDGGISTSAVPYLVMEYIEGSTIDCFAEDRRLNLRARVELFRQVCAAVQHAHQNLIVHRDIKPANVMVTLDGTPKLLDFGIAKLLSPEGLGQTIAWTRPAERLMTPEYASPEQIRGETITTATDVYGLGMLLYQLLTNRRPFQIANLSPANIERLICDTAPERPSKARTGTGALASETIPSDLDNIVLKAIHKDPACRYASAAELSEDLRRYLQGFPVMARTDSWRYRTQKFIVRHKAASFAAALFAVITTALSIGLGLQAARAEREAATSNRVADFLASLFQDSRPDERQGHGAGARDILDRGAERVPKELGGEPLVEARLLDILGTTYRDLGVLDRAESLLSQAYEIRARHLGADSEEAAESLQIIAEIASDRGDLEQAGTDYDKVLRIYLRTKGEKSEKTVEVINDIGELRFMLGDFEGAKKRYLQAIAICEQIKGPADWQTLNAKNDLQVVLADQGDYAAAETLAKEVLATEVQAMGPTNPNVALTLNNLGYILGQMAHFTEAQATFTRALDLRHTTRLRS